MGGIVPKAGPGGPLEFTFQELLLLRTTRRLLDAGVPASRVKRIWSTLKQQLSDEHPLSSIRIRADGDRAIAWDGKAPWQPDSGQFVLDFVAGDVAGTSEAPLFEVISAGGGGEEEGVEDVAAAPQEWPGEPSAHPQKSSQTPTDPFQKPSGAPAASLQKPGAPAVISIFRDVASKRAAQRRDAPGDESAEHWFQLGSEMEGASPLEARQAYLKALDADPNYADAHLNLGRLEHRAGDLAAAEARYRRAIQCDPEDATSHFNLGVLLEDRSCPQAAAEAYEQAIALDPDLADAHYNLGLLLEKLGHRADALRHLMAAHRLYAQ
jgi:tetratricopeptide (TPR) repeat protein